LCEGTVMYKNWASRYKNRSRQKISSINSIQRITHISLPPGNIFYVWNNTFKKVHQ
jgi:hypothetical protein